MTKKFREEKVMSDKVDFAYDECLKETLKVMGGKGLLLVSVDGSGKPNAMTIGWGTIGIIWGKPIFAVLVRPSRYTYGLMEGTDDFTVNVPPVSLSEAVSFCGTASGRDYDKFAEKNLTALPGRKVKSPVIGECVLHYECKTVHKNDVMRDLLSSEIDTSCYPSGNYHRVFFGEIVSVYGDSDFRDKI